MNQKPKYFLLTIFFAAHFLMTSARAERPWIVPPGNGVEPSQYANFATLRGQGRFRELREICQQVAEQYQGTQIGAQALINAANLAGLEGDLDLRSSIFETVSQQYPGSYFEALALLYLAPADGTISEQLNNRSLIAARFGAPSVEEILETSNLSALVKQTSALHPEKRLAISELYLGLVLGLDTAGRYTDAIKLGQFGRQALDHALLPGQVSFAKVTSGVILSHTTDPTVETPGSQSSTPQFTVSPQAGQSVPIGTPVIVTVVTGDYRHAQLDLGATEFTLDGVDRAYDFLVSSEQLTALTPDVPFEKVTLTLDSLLNPGLHTATIKLRPHRSDSDPPDGPPVVTHTWSFTVTSQPPQPTTQTLPALKDALIDNFDPNGNEGANGILALDKLLGRGSRSLVAFDLSEVDTNRLSKATLVLSIHKKEKILGCGSGEKISVQALTNSWVEGNGKTYKVLPLTARRRGNGSGATWNRDTDSNIADLVANGGYAWKGAQSATMPRTAPLVTARDDMQGTLQFDVTDDILNGAPHGWLLRKQHENLASRISFYSKEGAVAAGNPDLAPKLILEYDGPTAYLNRGLPNRGASAVASFLGIPRREVKLREIATDSEIPTLRDILRRNPKVALVGERLVFGFVAHHQPLVEFGARSVYRSWLRGEPRLG